MTNTDKTLSTERLREQGVEVLRRLSSANVSLSDASFIAGWVTEARAALASRTQEPAEPDQWRDLALQFDGHRIEALSMLRFAVKSIEGYTLEQGILREPLATLKAFLAKPPLPGEAVLAARIEALRAASITTPAPERSKEEVGVTVEALFEHGVTQQTQNYQFEQTGTGAWLFRCDEWLNITEVLSALEPASLHKGEAGKHSDDCGCGYCT